MYNRTDPRAIHETIIRDLVDLATDLKDTDELKFVFGKGQSFKSIASASSNLTIVFPNVVSRSMELGTAIMMSKAQERKCVAMLQMLFSAFQINDAKDAMEYISKFHTNLRVDGDITIDRFMSTLDAVSKFGESSGISVDKDMYEAVKEDMKNLGYYLPENTSNVSLNQYKYSRLSGGKVFKEQDDAPGPTTSVSISQSSSVARKIDDPAQSTKNKAEFYNKNILDSDIKKANELMPTMMVVNMINVDPNTGTKAEQVAVVGVKVKMYPVDSTDMLDRIRSKNRDGNGLNTFIRATTRELSFWKDLIFALDKAKLDALGSSRRGGTSAIWKLLERRGLKSRLRRSFKFTNDATAITTLTMTKDEVEYLKKMDNINMEDERTARKLMESLNLMSIIIVNEALESSNFIYDTGDDLYETITFTSLERESSDSTYKRVVNLMSKMH